jgi:hypothetical protein
VPNCSNNPTTNTSTSVPPPRTLPQFLRKSEVASPPAVVRIFTTQKTNMTSGTLAATGAGQTWPTRGSRPLVPARAPVPPVEPGLSLTGPTFQFPPYWPEVLKWSGSKYQLMAAPRELLRTRIIPGRPARAAIRSSRSPSATASAMTELSSTTSTRIASMVAQEG